MQNMTGNVCVAALVGGLAWSASGEALWSQMRGANHQARVASKTAPVTFDAKQVNWSKELKGVGFTTPVFGGGNMYLVNSEGEPREAGVRRLIALDPDIGAVRWEREASYTGYKHHKANHPTSGNPVTNEDGVFVVWYTGSEVEARGYGHDGSLMWKRSFGDITNRFGYGTSASLVGGKLFIPMSQNFLPSELHALDTKTGKVAWTVKTKEGKCGYGPVVPWRPAPGAKEVAVYSTMADGIVAFDPANGKEVWRLSPTFAANRVSMVSVSGNRLCVTSGSGRNGADAHVYTWDGKAKAPKEAYVLTRGASYVPTPLFHGDRLLMWNDIGIVSCFNADDGKELWKQRITSDTNASPIAVGDAVINVSMDGEVVSFPLENTAPEKPFRYDLDGRVNATPAYHKNRLYLRTWSGIQCIGK